MAQTSAERQRAYRDRKRKARQADGSSAASSASLASVASVTDITPAAQPGLGKAGQRLWDDVTGAWDLALHEEALLEQACRATDRLDAMAAELAISTLTVTNFRGDQVPHPLLCESRQQSALLARLFAALGLPSGEEETARKPSSRGHRGFYGVIPRTTA
jgi:hypothetical protein